MSTPASRRVLVTGASGFIGRQTLTPFRRMGFEIHAVTRNGTGPEGVTAHSCNLLDHAETARLVELIRPTHVLHTAWYVEHGRFWDAPENEDWVTATSAFARACLEVGVMRFVGVGSCIEYDWTNAETPRRETDPLASEHVYGRAKIACFRQLSDIATGTSMSLAWGRLFHLYGPDEDPRRLVRFLVETMKDGRPAEIGSGGQLRDFMSSVDAGAALAALCASTADGPVNIASGDPVTIADLAREIAGLVGRPDLLRIGARPDRPGEAPAMLADVTRLRTEIGFAQPVSRRERLSAMVGLQTN